MATSQRTRTSRPRGVLDRRRGKLIVVSAATIVSVYLCYRLAQPFLPALVWSITGAVVTHGYVRWLRRWITSPRWRAAVAVASVAVAVFAPVIGLVYYAAYQVGTALQQWQPSEFLAGWHAMLNDNSRLASTWQRMSQNLDLATTLGQLVEQVRGWAMAIVAGSIYSAFQALVALFILFFLYRDEDRILADIRKLSPLSNKETDHLLKRLDDTVHATIFGIVVVGLIQGTLGGVIFWLLGLPAPVLWGTVMALLAMVPYLGTFVVWAPTAVILLVNGDWGKAMFLAAWGMIVIGLIDNLLYPFLVGNRLRQHVVITFLAIVGGIAVFGASGIVLGPVIVTLTFFLLEVWRHRTAAGRAAESE